MYARKTRRILALACYYCRTVYILTIFFQLQRVKVEKQLVEKQRIETEERLKKVSRQTEDLDKKFQEIQVSVLQNVSLFVT
jgi:hypothetical protein